MQIIIIKYEVNNFLNKQHKIDFFNLIVLVTFVFMEKVNRKAKFEQLRNDFKEFRYDDFHYNIDDKGISMEWDFYIDDFVEFHPKLNIPKQSFLDFDSLTESMTKQLVFHIGMVELISYWKAICPKKIIIKPYKLNSQQVDFWKKIYFHGLGEFFYLNEIEVDMDNFLNLSFHDDSPIISNESIKVSESAIIPVGGGKDSVVSLEILKNSGDNLALIMNPRGASTATANIGGFEGKTIVINRFLDKKLLELNAEGYLNGHTPFSALLAFISFYSAAVSGRKYIALSNESSANESTVVGTMINHQYSKSLEFESDFREYTNEFLSSDIKYFSLLRPLSELQIASIFAKNSSYFKDFKSCNVGSKTNSWCGKCSKCLFTYIILSPFVAPEILQEIFSSNLLDDKDLKLYFDELTGMADVKPFECVGTVDEVNVALCLARKFYQGNLPFLLDYYEKKGGFNNCEVIDENTMLSEIETNHFLEDNFLNLLITKLNEND